MKRLALVAVVLICSAVARPALAATCQPTGFFRDSINMTAAMIDPPGTVSGTVDADGCNIAIYYGPGIGGTIKGANIFGSNYFGVLVNGDAGSVNVDILGSSIHDIGENPHNGSQHGIAVYYRGFSDTAAVTGRIAGNYIWDYQKGGIVANGQATQVNIFDNLVVGDGHVNFIAQNGIQVGFGAAASVMRNTVRNNSYIGFPGDGSASGGILIVGGPYYGGAFTVNVKANNNILEDNDVGVYLSNVEADFSAPSEATNNKVVNNTISNDQCFNTSYQAGVSDVGNNDKIITNTISGAGYIGCAPIYNPSSAVVDADTSFTNRPKVHATK